MPGFCSCPSKLGSKNRLLKNSFKREMQIFRCTQLFRYIYIRCSSGVKTKGGRYAHCFYHEKARQIPKSYHDSPTGKLAGGSTILGHFWVKFKEKVFYASYKKLGPETKNDSLTKKIMLTKFGYISSPYRLENSILSIKFWHFLKGLHKFVHSLIFMKIWDFAYFLNIKTMGISPTLGFDTTTTPSLHWFC